LSGITSSAGIQKNDISIYSLNITGQLLLDIENIVWTLSGTSWDEAGGAG
jgi:hypothetical protein